MSEKITLSLLLVFFFLCPSILKIKNLCLQRKVPEMLPGIIMGP